MRDFSDFLFLSNPQIQCSFALRVSHDNCISHQSFLSNWQKFSLSKLNRKGNLLSQVMQSPTLRASSGNSGVCHQNPQDLHFLVMFSLRLFSTLSQFSLCDSKDSPHTSRFTLSVMSLISERSRSFFSSTQFVSHSSDKLCVVTCTSLEQSVQQRELGNHTVEAFFPCSYWRRHSEASILSPPRRVPPRKY